ncbi:hypothetical protein AKI84_00875 [Streptococcus pneumoniae]|nr:hypothetical protein AKI84_00875 [Streptococcus pneumoniae]
MSYFKKYKFDKSQFKLGMRTFKTGIAVFLVLLRTSRILGNSIGGLYALVFFLLNTFFHEAFWVTLVVVPICTMLTIMTNVAMNNKAGVIGGVAAMLIITLSIPSGETISYVFVRVSETFMGVFVAIIVNYDIDRIRLFLEKKEK